MRRVTVVGVDKIHSVQCLTSGYFTGGIEKCESVIILRINAKGF
jgi:hypothetical protein